MDCANLGPAMQQAENEKAAQEAIERIKRLEDRLSGLEEIVAHMLRQQEVS